ncbi:hypothetical protein GQ44DRAFT_25817 [Phaeosphaeriaceae sp. PMI808]|nr:hypothetical protein GQ44DRAFT_25817 [Phaeosphaeriaceae sp. PMI808]
MVTGLLFKWEDSPALNHHCGFCNRPLHHPGARASCFGTHSEPCHRYHQAMFMRLRGHTCHYCRTIDEAHFRRHKLIAEVLHNIYESCGESEWSIIPAGPEKIEGIRECDSSSAKNKEMNRGLTLKDTSYSKRERKKAKCLNRAVIRSRVISRDEILRVETIIHSADSLSGSNNDEPCNTEEMYEIERHLKYNAHVYNNHGDGRDLKRFARLPDVDIDFEAEMERILNALRVTQLQRHNTRNRGLRGKELRTFQLLVGGLKRLIVEDLLLNKRDNLEIRMRRAGYLRYINKSAHNIVQDRYTGKDWKTGEKAVSSAGEFSGVISLAAETDPSNRCVLTIVHFLNSIKILCWSLDISLTDLPLARLRRALCNYHPLHAIKVPTIVILKKYTSA